MGCIARYRSEDPPPADARAAVHDQKRRELVAARLTWAMTRRGITRGALAERSGVSQTALSRDLSAKRLISTDALMRICPVLNLSADWVLGLREARERIEREERDDRKGAPMDARNKAATTVDPEV